MAFLKVGTYPPQDPSTMHIFDPRRPVRGEEPWIAKELLHLCTLVVVEEAKVGTPVGQDNSFVKIGIDDVHGMLDLTTLAGVAMVSTLLGEVLCVFIVDPAQFVANRVNYQDAVNAWLWGKKVRIAQTRAVIMQGVNISYGQRLPIGGFTKGYAPYHSKHSIPLQRVEEHAKAVRKAVNEVFFCILNNNFCLTFNSRVCYFC
jgi:hypothetical protein